MALLTTALALAEFVPNVVRFFGGDRKAEVAESVVNTAKKVAGVDDHQEALEKIRANPELQLQLQREMNQVVIAEFENETRRLETVNQTMRVEAQSGDKFVSRWRPFFGYIIAITWGAQMAALSIVIVKAPEKAPAIITAMASLSVMWGVALSVLGISVHKRSQDKQVAAGQAPQRGIAGAIAKRIMGRG